MDTATAIAATCSTLMAPNQVAEVRVLGINGRDGTNGGGWFNHIPTLAQTAARYDQKNPYGVYITLNPLHPACLARSNNKLIERTRTLTADKDVAHRNWLLVDIDPNRVTGVSANDAETATTLDRGHEIIAALTDDYDWPPPAIAASGNGTHLLYRISLPNDDAAKKLMTKCLERLGKRFDNKDVTIDRTVHNAARIVRLYGTHARKGANIPDRPHRQSHLIEPIRVFADVRAVAVDGLRSLASSRKIVRGPRRKSEEVETGDFDLAGFIGEHNIDVARQEPWDGGTRYILTHCLFDSSHTGTSACLGQNSKGAVFYKCQHDSCYTRQWSDVRQLFEGSKTPAATAPRHHKAPDPDKPDPFALAQAFIEEECTDPDTGHITIRRWRQNVYRWTRKAKVYALVDTDTLKVWIYRFLRDAVSQTTGRLYSDVRACLESLITIDPKSEMPFVSTVDPKSLLVSGEATSRHWTIVRNGIVDIDRLASAEPYRNCLSPHTPTWFSTTILPFPFPTSESQLQCYRWIDFLSEIFDDDEERISLVQEAFGYCFEDTLRLETFFVFHGQGRNGKSTVLDVLTMLLGDDNVSSLAPQQFGDRFMLGALQGKRANVCADMRELDSVDEGTIKAAVSGDMLTSDRKYQQSFNFRASATLFFCSNVLPRFRDTSLGIWRRMRLVPFEHIVPIEKVDVQLREKLQAELPAIFLWAIQGLIRLRENKTFTAPEACKKAVYQYRLQCFPVMAFLDECCTREASAIGAPAQVRCGQLWTTYRQWCQASGLTKPKPLHAFVQDVVGFDERIMYSPEKDTARWGMVLYGIRLKEDLQFGQPKVDQAGEWAIDR